MEKERDLTFIDNVRLEVGEEYWIRYKWGAHSHRDWEKVKITRLTRHGHPWGKGRDHNGIITDSYLIKQTTPKNELEQHAKNWIKENGVSSDLTLPELFAKMYSDFNNINN